MNMSVIWESCRKLASQISGMSRSIGLVLSQWEYVSTTAILRVNNGEFEDGQMRVVNL
jgi:hypothetical protein